MTKKFISSIITVAIILSLLVVPHVQAANLLQNSGFETGTGNWNVVEASAWFVTGKDKVSGRTCLAVTGRKQDYATPQQFLNLQNGKTYTVSMWVKTAKGTDDLTVFVEPYRADGTKWPINICTVPVGEEWTHVQQTFTLKAEEPFTKIKILSKMTSLTDLYFDDFEVWEGSAAGEAQTGVSAPSSTDDPKTPTNPELVNTAEADKTKINLISNSDFEKGITGYKAENAELKQVKGVVSGNYAMQVTPVDGAAVVTADADMINAKEYNLNMWYKGDAISVYTDGGAVLYEGEAAADWTLVNESFVYAASNQKPCISIESHGEFYLDAVSLFEVPLVAETLGASDNLIAANDPGFESRPVSGTALGNNAFGDVNWISRGTAKISNAQAHTGVNSVEVTSGGGPRAAVYGLTQGKQYFISVWVYPTQSGLRGELIFGGSSNNRTSKPTLTANTWNQISGVVTAPPTGDAGLTATHGKTGNTLYLNMENLSAAMYVDDFEIVPYESYAATAGDGPVVVNPVGITSEGKDVAQIWDFHCSPSTPGLLAGWRVQVGNNNGTAFYPIKPEYQDGITRLDCTLKNGNMFTERYTNYNIDAEKYKYISIKAQNLTHSDTFRIAFWTADKPEDGNRIMYTVKWPKAEGLQEIILDMSDCDKWEGTIARIGLSPADQIAVDQYDWGLPGESVLLESISVFADEPASVEVLTGNAMTRAEFVDMLVEKLELKSVLNSQTAFHDVGTGAPWHNSVMAAEETGIVSGNGVGYFNPSNYITREHVAVMLKRACDYLDKQTDRIIPTVNFADAVQFSAGMQEAASFVANAGIMTAAYGGYFNPQATITDTEANEIINRVADWIGGTAKNGAVFVSADVAGTYDIVRMSVEDPKGAAYTNPYDYNEVTADAVFTAPDGSTLVLPGYYDMYSDYQYDPRRIPDEFSQDNATYWKFRFAPTMAGEWKYEIKVTHDGNVTSLGNGKITAIDTGRPGFIKRDENNPRFVYENGDVFNAVGINLKSPIIGSGEGGYEVYEDYLEKYAENNGINVIRPWFQSEEDKNMEDYQTGLGRFNSFHAQRLDYMFALARQKDVTILPAIKSQHRLKNGNWLQTRSQYPSITGGPLDFGAEFFSNEECIQAYKSLLRYIIARYSAYDNVLLWEFFNEGEGITGWREEIESVDAWHDEMFAFVAEIDPYDHIAGSGSVSLSGEYVLDSNEMQDFSAVHSYNTIQPALMIRANAAVNRKLYNIPHIIEEMSPRAETGLVEMDPEGRSTHEIIWSSVAAGNAGTTPAWFWWGNDGNNSWGWVHEHWNLYKPLTDFLKDFNWPDEDMKLVNFKTTSAEKGDFTIPAGYYMQEQYNDAALGEVPIKSEYEYDFANNIVRDPDDIIYESMITSSMPEYTFKVNLPKSTKFKLALVGEPIYVQAGNLGQVSVSIDGTEQMVADWIPSEFYVKEFPVTVSAGEHTITIKCVSGRAWLGWVAFEDVAPLVVAEGAVGKDNAMIFVRDTELVYSKSCYNDYEPPVITGATVDLTGLTDGTYDLIWWDTYKSGEVSKQEITVSGGVAPTVEVPTFTRDIAAKIVRKSN